MSHFSASPRNFATTLIAPYSIVSLKEIKGVFSAMATLRDRRHRHYANDTYNTLGPLQTIRDDA